MYVCTPMYVCIHVCMYACMYACIHVCMCVCMQACKHVCMYVCMHVRTSGWRSDPSGSTTYILSFPSSGTVLLPRASQMTGRQITESPAMTRSGRSTALPDKHGKHLLSSKAVALLVLTCPYCALLVLTVPYLSLPCLSTALLSLVQPSTTDASELAMPAVTTNWKGEEGSGWRSLRPLSLMSAQTCSEKAPSTDGVNVSSYSVLSAPTGSSRVESSRVESSRVESSRVESSRHLT